MEDHDQSVNHELTPPTSGRIVTSRTVKLRSSHRTSDKQSETRCKHGIKSSQPLVFSPSVLLRDPNTGKNRHILKRSILSMVSDKTVASTIGSVPFHSRDIMEEIVEYPATSIPAVSLDAKTHKYNELLKQTYQDKKGDGIAMNVVDRKNRLLQARKQKIKTQSAQIQS